MTVRYWGGEVDVRLGDRVETRALFRRRVGRVVYVPGISPVNEYYEHHGLTWVAIRCEGMLVGVIVDAKDGMLRKNVKFLGRDDSSYEALPANLDELEHN